MRIQMHFLTQRFLNASVLLPRVCLRAPHSPDRHRSPRREGRGDTRAPLAESASELFTFLDNLPLKVLKHYNQATRDYA